MPALSALRAASLALAFTAFAPGLASAQSTAGQSTAALAGPGQSAPGGARLTEIASPAPAFSLPDITYEELIGSPDRTKTYSPIALGVGAIGGVLAFNAISGAVLTPVTAGVALDSALGMSRVYAISSAVAGALIGQWIYDRTFAR